MTSATRFQRNVILVVALLEACVIAGALYLKLG